jgi:hypothetical protein
VAHRDLEGQGQNTSSDYKRIETASFGDLQLREKEGSEHFLRLQEN